ncbi:qcr9 subunit 9 of the ubiquinol cytochrome-c reductase complex [Microbotryomycetes sp. JL201]|nr:qcr9 subunit 9 of the ubiquinol cytochrome-c reductase complex [Microbotryomycetes sp. JL201]
MLSSSASPPSPRHHRLRTTGAFAFGMGFDKVTTAWWDAHNKGKQWQDIRDKYATDS